MLHVIRFSTPDEPLVFRPMPRTQSFSITPFIIATAIAVDAGAILWFFFGH